MTDKRRMSFVIRIVFLILPVYLVIVQACSNDHGGVYEIEFIKFDVQLSFHLHNKSNLSTYSLTAIYTWDLKVPYGCEYDGILYKLVDRDTDREDSRSGVYPYSNIIPSAADFVENACEGLHATLWTKANDSSPIQCSLPCKKYFPTDCPYNEVCSMLKEGYTALPWNQQRLEHPIKFGRVYDLVILAYHDWYAGNGHGFRGNKVVKFCREELIANHNVSHEDAEDFCKDNQEFADGSVSTGPPSLMEMYHTSANLTTNRATVSYRFKEPHDISPNSYFIGFNIYVRDGKYRQFLEPYPRDDHRTRSDRFYSVTITNVEFDETNWILVTPFTKRIEDNLCSPHCSDYGFGLKEYFRVIDIDACTRSDISERYCDAKANCTDLPPSNAASAICSCPVGMSGNGINDTMDEGTGCHEPEPCVDTNHTCDDVSCAGNITCACGMSNAGSGRLGGFRCDNSYLIIGLAVAIPSFIVLILLAVVLLAWRHRRPQNREVRLHEEDL